MARPLSTTAKQGLFAQETEQVFLPLVTITHPDLASPVRVVRNTEDIVSRGQEFIALGFDLTLPDDREETVPGMRLEIDNVDRRIVEAIRTITSPAQVTTEVVLASQPDTVEAAFEGYTLRGTEYDALRVTGTLTLEDVLNEPFPVGLFTPSVAPGLF